MHLQYSVVKSDHIYTRTTQEIIHTNIDRKIKYPAINIGPLIMNYNKCIIEGQQKQKIYIPEEHF